MQRNEENIASLREVKKTDAFSFDVLQPPSCTKGANRLAFLLHTLELCNHFGPVWDALPKGSFDVLYIGLQETQVQQALKRWQCGISDVNELLASGTRYSFLISNHPVVFTETPLIKRLANWNVRFMYAAGKSGWNLSDWNRLYDVIMSFGPYHSNAFSSISDATIVQMGYPRFDRYFNERPDRADLLSRYACDPSRKTVVWLPTWKELSSVSWFDEQVSELTSEYNVVIKLHPLMSEQEPGRVLRLQKYHFDCLITDASDNLPLYQLADYMLFDYGGPPMAAIYADKNLLLLNVPGAEFDPLTGSNSTDIQIRKVFGSVNLADRCIKSRLADADMWATQAKLRKQLRKVFFAPYYGFSAGVAANALMRLETMVENTGSEQLR